MNDHIKALEQLENENEPNEHDLENSTAYDRQQMAEMGHYTHVDQLRDRLDYYPVGSFPEEKLRTLQLEDPMGEWLLDTWKNKYYLKKREWETEYISPKIIF